MFNRKNIFIHETLNLFETMAIRFYRKENKLAVLYGKICVSRENLTSIMKVKIFNCPHSLFQAFS